MTVNAADGPGAGGGRGTSNSKISNAAKEKLAMMELQMRTLKVCNKWVICPLSLSFLFCIGIGEDMR